MLNKQIPKKIRKMLSKLGKPLSIILGAFALTIIVFLIYNLIFFRKIFPGVSIAGISLAGQIKSEGVNLLSEKIEPPQKVVLVSDSQNYEIVLENIDFAYDIPGSVDSAYKIGRTGNTLSDFYTRFTIPFKKSDLPLKVILDETRLNEHLSIIAGNVSVNPVQPQASYVEGVVVIKRGSSGKDISQGKLSVNIIENLSQLNSTPIPIPEKVTDPSLSEEEAKIYKSRAENFVGKSIELTFADEVFLLTEDEIFKFLDPKNGYANGLEVIVEISSSLNTNPQNPVFVFDGGKVVEFAPAQDGVKVRADELGKKIVDVLGAFETSGDTQASIEIPAKIIPPKLTTDEVNNLGIEELIGKGVSRFRGSISSRIHNIGVAASKFNGTLVAPGETFSFNEILGDVSAYTGYKQAYIIKDGRTVLGDGGGVCQVSTTFFRAALDAGLPIVERRAHSYRVGYYEQDSLPGLDATVYAPYTDLKIKNDTPAHILIQTEFYPKTATLIFEIYGTSDGRVATTTKPIVTNVVPPPEDLYQDDPTLPEGTTKQIDYQAWGANVYFDYEVEKGGEIIYEKTFYSNFRPWQAVYLRGTGPVQ